ncbi:hypothetical protein [Paludibacterium yongneupense]|uniref:hypothetical protein n=1 Tax=Paludibacterium yongneupense TaxID=400061 RepID=UPI00041DF41B|nr:hypothetical protein [Paludibacterium yongneupense]
MAVVAMGWLYVVLMLSAAQDSVAAGVLVALALGVAPMVLVAALRRRRRGSGRART